MDINRKNSRTWAKLGPRATYGLAMLDLIEKNDKVFALSADLGNSSGLSRVMGTYPDKFINTGIAEQNLIGVSAGMAKEGLIPFASSFAPFITHRCADQIRMNMGYMHLNMKTVGLGSGISMALLGNSHYGSDDLSFLRAIPNLVILSPSDCATIVKCVNVAANYVGPVYIRLTGTPGLPSVYSEDFEFKIGQSNQIEFGTDVLILATGHLVYEALQACSLLKKIGISASLYDMLSLKPLDTKMLDDSIRYRLIVTVEEHSVIGGLGSAVCEFTAQNGISCKMINIALPDSYLKTGSYDFMIKSYGLDANGIFEQIKKALDC